MTREEELLFEQALGAARARHADGSLASSPAWHDLPDQAREELFDVTSAWRQLEAALDPEGLSTTGRAVLARLGGKR